MAKLLEGFVNVFGSKWHFFLALVITVAWLAPILSQGYANWTSGIGLTGNNYESTAEYFLEIAILYVARETDRRTAAMRDRQNVILDQNAVILSHLNNMCQDDYTVDVKTYDLVSHLVKTIEGERQ